MKNTGTVAVAAAMASDKYVYEDAILNNLKQEVEKMHVRMERLKIKAADDILRNRFPAQYDDISKMLSEQIGL